MKNQPLPILTLMTVTLMSMLVLTIGTTFASTTITVEKMVHVTTAEGSDLVVQAGEYALDSAEEWLRITPSNGQTVDAHLLEAHVGKHEEKLTDPLALSVTGVEVDSHHLVLLLPDGKSFEATGSYSGIRSRGRSRIDIQRIIALAKKRKKAQRTEFVTPTLGGSGGNRSYNLDCGNRAVLVGAIFKAGRWFDALGIICQRVSPQTGKLGDEFTRGPIGGGGGDARIKRCNEGDVIQGAKARSGQFLHRLAIFCSPWEPARKAPVFSTNENCVGDRTRNRCKGLGGNDLGGSQSDVFFCPRGKVGKALRGRHGIYIDSTRFVCDLWNK